jgi:hypothetical protein
MAISGIGQDCENSDHHGDYTLGDRFMPCPDCEAEAWDRFEDAQFEAFRDARFDD